MRILSRIKIKLLAFCLLITLVLFSFTGCKDYFGYTSFKKYAPTNFPNTVWATENGEITFRVAESETMRYKGTRLNRYGDPVYSYEYASAFGEVNKGEVKYDVFMYIGRSELAYMKVISEELPQVGEVGKYDEETKKYTLVCFTISNLDEKHFGATVSQSSIYDEGTVFDFYRQE